MIKVLTIWSLIFAQVVSAAQPIAETTELRLLERAFAIQGMVSGQKEARDAAFEEYLTDPRTEPEQALQRLAQALRDMNIRDRGFEAEAERISAELPRMIGEGRHQEIGERITAATASIEVPRAARDRCEWMWSGGAVFGIAGGGGLFYWGRKREQALEKAADLFVEQNKFITGYKWVINEVSGEVGQEPIYGYPDRPGIPGKYSFSQFLGATMVVLGLISGVLSRFCGL